MLGFTSYAYPAGSILSIDGEGLLVAGPCLGLELFVAFGALVVAYPGNWRNKLWFVPLGLLSIHVLNLLRVIALLLLLKFAPSYLEINHKYIFYVLVYALIFLMWLLFVWKYAKPDGKKKARNVEVGKAGTGVQPS
jgi:exosortase/archaeosortase family protein